jgi:fatty acid desaturase
MSDWAFPMSLGKIVKIYILDFLGKGAVANFQRAARYNLDPEFKKLVAPELKKSQAIRYAFYIVLAALLTIFGGWKYFLLYWMLPLFWVLPAILRLRNMSEHYGLTWESDLEGTREVLCGPIEMWLLAPHGINYHISHHFYPSVPYFNLKKLNAYMMEIPEFKSGAHINTSYVLPRKKAVWRDWITTGRKH